MEGEVQTSFLRNREYDPMAGTSPHVNMTNASLTPFTGPVKQLISEFAAMSRTNQKSVRSLSLAIAMIDAMMEGTSRMKMKVMIDAELDFFIRALKNIPIPVRANAYSEA